MMQGAAAEQEQHCPTDLGYSHYCVNTEVEMRRVLASEYPRIHTDPGIAVDDMDTVSHTGLDCCVP